MHRSTSKMGTVSRRRLLFEDGLHDQLAGRISEAIGKYQCALELGPDFDDVHNNLGAALAGQGRFDEAIAHYRRAIALQPRNAAAHGNLGAALAAQRHFAEAIAHYQAALALNPDSAGVHYNLAIVLGAQGRTSEAVAHYQSAIGLRDAYAEAHNNLANLLEAQARPEEALAHYERAIAINPRHAEAHNNLGNMLRERGDPGGALEHYNRAIESGPGNPEIHLHRAEIKTFHAGDPDLAAMETLAWQPDLPLTKRPYIHFALAKALEDCGDHPSAFAHLTIGNTIKRRQVPYDEQSVRQRFRQVAARFDRSLIERLSGDGDSSAAPIFVVGMPRSGSTLIEQILASHPQVCGAGELRDFEIAEQIVFTAGSRPVAFPEYVPGIDSAALRRLAQIYLSRLPALGEGQLRVVDKALPNFTKIGLIRLILPNARIIHTMRDPVDTCLSCYSKLFTLGQPFTYDLAELGRYYRMYTEMMSHWRSVLPQGAMLEVSYEDVVDDLEGQARRLLDYCGLPWDDRCLSFHTSGGVVRTASVAQVRQPLFRTSLQRWRKYEANLGPLLNALGDLVREDRSPQV